MTKESSKKSKTNKPGAGKTKSNQLITLLGKPAGASIAELMKPTGWQRHSVQGLLAGALKKKGYKVTSAVGNDGVRRYRLDVALAS